MSVRSVLLAATAIVALSGSACSSAKDPAVDATTTMAPAAPATSPAVPATSPAAPLTTAAGGKIDLTPRERALCEGDLDAIKTAMEAYKVLADDYPTALSQLAEGDSATLDAPPDPTHWSYSGGGPTGIVGVGRCAGIP